MEALIALYKASTAALPEASQQALARALAEKGYQTVDVDLRDQILTFTAHENSVLIPLNVEMTHYQLPTLTDSEVRAVLNDIGRNDIYLDEYVKGAAPEVAERLFPASRERIAPCEITITYDPVPLPLNSQAETHTLSLTAYGKLDTGAIELGASASKVAEIREHGRILGMKATFHLKDGPWSIGVAGFNRSAPDIALYVEMVQLDADFEDGAWRKWLRVADELGIEPHALEVDLTNSPSNDEPGAQASAPPNRPRPR